MKQWGLIPKLNKQLISFLFSTSINHFIYLQDIILNDEVVNLATIAGNRTTTPSSLPQPGCPTHTPCSPDWCLNNGVCQDFWTYKHCFCPTGFSGDVCEAQHMAHFSGSKSLHFLQQNVDITSIELWFSAVSEDGLILHTVSIIKQITFSLLLL